MAHLANIIKKYELYLRITKESCEGLTEKASIRPMGSVKLPRYYIVI